MSIATAISIAGSCFSLGGLALIVVRSWSDVENRHLVYGMYAIGCWLCFVANVLEGDLPWAVFQGSLAVIYSWLWWRGRRNGRGKRALKELGAKSRERVEALVRQMTPSPIPAPGGAR